MTTERKPVAFGDMRNWMKALKSAGELREIDAEVDWNVELGTVTRMAQGPGTGPALLFKNIKDYNKNTTRCGQVFAGGLGSYRRVAMMMGLAARHPSARTGEDRPHHHGRPRFRRASSRKAPARRTSSPARTSTSSNSRCRSGTGSTAAAIC